MNKVVRKWNSSTFTDGMLSRGWMPPHPTLFLRREWYLKIGCFDVRYKISADYYSVLCLFMQNNFKALYLPKIFVKMRLGGASNKSLKNILLKSYEDLDALHRSGAGNIITLFYKNIRKIHQFN